MDRDNLIEYTMTKIKQLPIAKIQEVNDFADFLLSKIDNKIIIDNIQKITSESKSFHFLEEEEVLYSVKDLKKMY